MSQIIYTELEAFPLRWPYLQLEPLDAPTTKTWQTDQTFNTASQSTYTVGDVGTPVDESLTSSKKFMQIFPQFSTHQISSFEAFIRKVGEPGPLKVEFWTIKRSSTDFLQNPFHEPLPSVSGGWDNISPTTWRAETRSFPRPVKLTGLRVRGSWPDRYQIRLANQNGSPSTTIIAQGNLTSTSDWGEVTFATPIDLAPNTLYSFIAYRSDSTSSSIGHGAVRVSVSDFGTTHSTWVSTNSGSTWTSAGRTNYAFLVAVRPLAYVLDTFIDAFEVPQSSISTTGAWINLAQNLMFTQDNAWAAVFSTTSGEYIIQRGNTYRGESWTQNATDLTENHLTEISGVFDGSTWTYRPHDFLVRKTHLQHVTADTFDKSYFLGPGYYSPKTSIQIKATSGTVYAFPAIKKGIFYQKASEKSTTSTTYTTLTWDMSGSVPEIILSTADYLYFFVRGNGAYNQVSYEPRLYYNKNPVTPRDFGFTELYLMKIRGEVAGSLARINDKTNIYFAAAGDSVVIDPNFRAPVSKIQVVTGRVTCDLLGVV